MLAYISTYNGLVHLSLWWLDISQPKVA